MTPIARRIANISTSALQGMARGIEKESLRVLSSGGLALTPHPIALGSALTHPTITTDFSESQLELITGVHQSVDSCIEQLTQIHQYVYHAIDPELLWASSMPCGLPTDETIPLGRYGSSNVGRAKSVYRMGLGHRYGRRMQTISGIHYNWSLPGLGTDDYFSLIRNFRRQVFLLMMLFGASPAVCRTFVSGRQHSLEPLGTSGTLHLPYATSLRMGKLGYQSDAQSSIAASFNSLMSYGASLEKALTTPYPAYEAIGIQNPGGDYNQLATTLLQIENEYYGTIRPKRTIRSGERPLHALRDRGVEYIEVRCLDLNPFLPVGIDADTARFIDMFLLHCWLSDSPPDSVDEVAMLARNQQAIASQGRDPLLTIERADGPISPSLWGQEIIEQCLPIAVALDEALTGNAYQSNLKAMSHRLAHLGDLPSAQVLNDIASTHHHSYISFAHHQSEQAKAALLAKDFPESLRAMFEAQGAQSLVDQRNMELADHQSFEQYRSHYVAPDRLVVQPQPL